jgi:hypothetical protein
MYPVSSLNLASYWARKGLDRAIALAEKSAWEIASHPSELALVPDCEAFLQLHNARVQAFADIAVLRTVNSLYHELWHLPRI